jgi:hypothetical protein
MTTGRIYPNMLPTHVPLATLGPLASPVGVVGVLVVLAVIILIGRFVLSMAWKLVTIALIVVGTLYVLSLLGFGLGFF